MDHLGDISHNLHEFIVMEHAHESRRDRRAREHNRLIAENTRAITQFARRRRGSIQGMDDAANDMIAWAREVFPDANATGYARKFVEEINELLGTDFSLPDDWTQASLDPTEICDCSLVLVALSRYVNREIGDDMIEKMKVNRARRHVRQDDGTYRHEDPA